VSTVQTDAVAALAALGQATRLELFQTLVNAGAEGLSASWTRRHDCAPSRRPITYLPTELFWNAGASKVFSWRLLQQSSCGV